MIRFRTAVTFLLAIAAVALVAAGCGSDSDNGAGADSGTKPDAGKRVTKVSATKLVERFYKAYEAGSSNNSDENVVKTYGTKAFQKQYAGNSGADADSIICGQDFPPSSDVGDVLVEGQTATVQYLEHYTGQDAEIKVTVKGSKIESADCVTKP